jgi:predicted alpha/beta superfamily hydrolase
MFSRGEIRPVILVGSYNTGVHRISEYTPTRDRRLRKGGKADRYARMLAREIKPFIDREYRTLRGASNAAVGGSSLGALASLAAALCYPRVFGGVAAISPSVWWDDRSTLQLVRSVAPRPRIWLDIGTAEGRSPQQTLEDSRALRETLIAAGWQPDRDLAYHEFEGAEHSERAWAARFGAVLEFLFGATAR